MDPDRNRRGSDIPRNMGHESTDPGSSGTARTDPGTPNVSRLSSSAEKISLFKSIFRGREELFPVRFESHRTGRSGYQPACGNEWVRGVCEKPRIKCSVCPNQAFHHVTDEVIRWHLTGRDDRGRAFVMGVYPLLLDETCHFLAVDFDGDAWESDAGAFRETCWRLKIPVTLERSRSGNGAHAWFFFEQAIPARRARNLGSWLLTETMENRPEVGMRSYDRMFPNQDTLPKGGFGNLIALPLQKIPRDQGNSVFLDDTFTPYPDQWEYLSKLVRIGSRQTEELAEEAERRGRITGVRWSLDPEEQATPWNLVPSRSRREAPITESLPEQLEVVLGDQIYIPKETLPPALRIRLIRLAAFQNPDFYKTQAMRLSTHDKPRIIACAEDFLRHIGLPRGCLEELQILMRTLKIRLCIRDERFGGTALKVAFQGNLRAEQQVAAEAMLAHENGVLAATTAFGKTVIAAWLIAQRGVNTLVLVHRRQLLDQWLERLTSFLGLPPKAIGCIGAGRKRVTGTLDVAIMQSLVRKGVVDDRVADYGHLVVDECHHLSAFSFEQLARRAKATFVTGLSATVTRKDGHHPIIFMQCGAVRYRVDARSQAAARPFTHHVIVRPTGFRDTPPVNPDPRTDFQLLYTALTKNTRRNDLICEDVAKAALEGRSPVVLTERTEHLEALAALLAPRITHLIILRGGMGRKDWRNAMTRLHAVPHNEARVVLATGGFLGEGFDDSRLDTLFLTLPVSWRGTIAQYAGRLHRLHESKREVRIYDYADFDVPVLARMFNRRCRGYEAIGYSILLPASAVPGWPREVALPVDPLWKRTYSASIQRLIRDGVDLHLGQLFLESAIRPLSGAEGEARARSASEAFLFRRLESMPETEGRFRLNAELPIPFDDQGKMEVDFLCAEASLVLELDGAQHLSDAEAYRRDRRKDACLQEHGYFVLRFLAEDLGEHLDTILDTILRALVHRRNLNLHLEGTGK